MEYDIVKEALTLAGYGFEPQFVALGDVPELLRHGRVDGALTMQTALGIAAHYSDEYITYHNYAMTLAARGFAIDRVEDLAGKTIVAFQNARQYLGAAFARAIADNPGYREVAQQSHQNLELFAGTVDVVVADINIFQWYNRDPRVTQAVDSTQQVIYHNIFPPTPYLLAFREASVRHAFNGALATLKASGRYDAIVARYTSRP
jgi:polar amino acid transport system substrate-binding protein